MMGVGAKRALGLYRSCAPRHHFEADRGRFPANRPANEKTIYAQIARGS